MHPLRTRPTYAAPVTGRADGRTTASCSSVPTGRH